MAPVAVLAKAFPVIGGEDYDGISRKGLKETGKATVKKLGGRDLMMKGFGSTACGSLLKGRPGHAPRSNILRTMVGFPLEAVRGMGFPKINKAKEGAVGVDFSKEVINLTAGIPAGELKTLEPSCQRLLPKPIHGTRPHRLKAILLKSLHEVPGGLDLFEGMLHYLPFTDLGEPYQLFAETVVVGDVFQCIR